MIMKTIINDGHMVYNVVPVTEEYNNGETKYLIGDRDDYFIEDYFSNDYLYSYLYWVCIINVALLSITLLEHNYILHNSKKKKHSRFEVWVLYFLHYTSNFNKFYSVLLVFLFCFQRNNGKNIYTWHYDCIPSDLGDGIQPSTYYYSIFNNKKPTLTDLIDNYFEYHPNEYKEDCGNEDIECCHISILCNEYINTHKNYAQYNESMNFRAEKNYRFATTLMHISLTRCSDVNIIKLISNYVYDDRQQFYNFYIFYIFFILFFAYYLIAIYISCNYRREYNILRGSV